MDLVAPRHVGSSQTRARTRVPCISRQILNHCATREALNVLLKCKDAVNLRMFPFFPAYMEVWRGLCILAWGSCVLISTCHHFMAVQKCITWRSDMAIPCLSSPSGVVWVCCGNIGF